MKIKGAGGLLASNPTAGAIHLDSVWLSWPSPIGEAPSRSMLPPSEAAMPFGVVP